MRDPEWITADELARIRDQHDCIEQEPLFDHESPTEGQHDATP